MNTSCLWLTEACNTLRSVYREGAGGECTQVDRRLKDPKFADVMKPQLCAFLSHRWNEQLEVN